MIIILKPVCFHLTIQRDENKKRCILKNIITVKLVKWWYPSDKTISTRQTQPFINWFFLCLIDVVLLHNCQWSGNGFWELLNILMTVIFCTKWIVYAWPMSVAVDQICFSSLIITKTIMPDRNQEPVIRCCQSYMFFFFYFRGTKTNTILLNSFQMCRLWSLFWFT